MADITIDLAAIADEAGAKKTIRVELKESDYHASLKVAKSLNISLAELIRRLLGQVVAQSGYDSVPTSVYNPRIRVDTYLGEGWGKAYKEDPEKELVYVTRIYLDGDNVASSWDYLCYPDPEDLYKKWLALK